MDEKLLICFLSQVVDWPVCLSSVAASTLSLLLTIYADQAPGQSGPPHTTTIQHN